MSGSLQEQLALLPADQRSEALAVLSPKEQEEMLFAWRGYRARPNQLPPGTPGSADTRTDWRYWLLKAGRGFGKTRTGAETVREWESQGKRIIHLIGATTADVRNVMVEGPGGLLQCYPEDQRPYYEPSKRMVTWPSGAVAHTFSAEEPERLRGPQCECVWGDEIAAWGPAGSTRGIDTWDNMAFGLRLGSDPRGVFTSTPKPVKLFRQVAMHPKTVMTGGSTYENRAHLAAGFFEDIITKYEGTRLGRQELLAELLEDIPGALWTRQNIGQYRVTLDKVPQLIRAVVAIDPAVTANEDSDETGIGVVGLGIDGHLYVLEDASLRASPGQWARRAVQLFVKWREADKIVAEVNNGGDLVEANIRMVHPDIPYSAVRATKGKLTRAEPVAALYEQGKVHHVGNDLELLEDQLVTYVPGVTEKSPDRMDWLVWACYDLKVDPMESAILTATPGRRISQY